MSKIETALRRAKSDRWRAETVGQSEAARAQDRIKGDGFVAERVRRNLPAVIRLEPYTSYELDEDHLAANRVINFNYPEQALTSYKMLRTRLLQKMDANGWQALAVTSPRDGVGKSLTAVNLAIAMASHGAHDVYLIDLDLRNPQISQCLGLPAFDLDVGEYLAGRTPVSRVCCTVGIDHLMVLPSSQRQPNSSELITAEPMRNLFGSILNTVSRPIIIVDLPAILSADDALAIAPWVDAMLLVVGESETDREDVTRSLEILRHTTIAGVVLNKSREV
jgi:capsular exopolysaccharide synthesis family protein